MPSMLAERFIQATLLVAAVIHLAPTTGLAGADALQRLYGLAPSDPATLLLLRHRAVLFALVALPLLAAIALRRWRLPALVAALISMASFIALAAGMPLNAELSRVLRIDLVVAALVAIAIVVHRRTAPPG